MGTTTGSRTRRGQHAQTVLSPAEAVDRMAGGIVHELSNYLAAIRGYCELARMKCSDDDTLVRYLDAAAGTTGEVTALIRALLVFSREQLRRPEGIDLERLAAGMEDVMRQLAGDAATGSRAAPARILLVEYDDCARETTERLLKALGYDVLAVRGGERALRLLAETQPRLDLLVTEVVMPGLSGPELFTRIRERRKTIRCLFISGSSDHEALRHGLDRDAAGFLRKPFSAKSLSEKISELLESPPSL